MKKSVTVFLILTPVMFVLWAASICFSGVMLKDFVNFMSDFIKAYGSLSFNPFTTSTIIVVAIAGLAVLLSLLMIIIAPARKRGGYAAEFLLFLLGALPATAVVVNKTAYDTYLMASTPETLGVKILMWVSLVAAVLDLLFIILLFILTCCEIGKKKGPKKHLSKKERDEAITVASSEPLNVIPGSEPVDGMGDEEPEDVRAVVKDELDKMYSRLAVRENVKTQMLRKALAEKDIAYEFEDEPEEIIDEKDIPEEVKEETVPEVVPEQQIQIKSEPVVETVKEDIPEPIEEVKPVVTIYDQAKVETPKEAVVMKPTEMKKAPVIEEVIEEIYDESYLRQDLTPVREDVLDEDEYEDILVSGATGEEIEAMENPVEEVEESVVITDVPVGAATIEELVVAEEEPVVEEAPVEEMVEPQEPVVEETVEEPTVEEPAVEEAPVEEPAEEPTVEETPVEEPATEPVAEEAPVVAPVVEEAASEKVYERISFVDRMINADDLTKNHYNELKNEIMAYGVKSRVSNSGDAFRLHTKTYVKITIAGKSLKLYYALDPKDYENTTLPFQDVGKKGIYAEIPLAFKVKSGLSMKRAKELIADAMAKDNLEKGEVGDKDYVEHLEEELEKSFED